MIEYHKRMPDVVVWKVMPQCLSNGSIVSNRDAQGVMFPAFHRDIGLGGRATFCIEIFPIAATGYLPRLSDGARLSGAVEIVYILSYE